ncbi:MAG TPA: 3'(2'),5'-bisphosphate nucleotidase CysQ [Pseudomonadales bacterium]|nr:3'(2'),5'-bisphosphate nucleotidase CysQ [Pseudomonadales bacterium]
MLEGISEICRRAGDAILEVYERVDHEVETKQDDSPLTAADLAAHKIILEGLKALAPDVPVLSEESRPPAYDVRKKWNRYFLVDPLDGTKEFINRNGEFTVNIALVDEGAPVGGVVFVPVKDVLYAGWRGEDGKAAWVVRDGERRSIRTRALKPRLREGEPLTVVASRRHGGETLELVMSVLAKHFASVDTTNMGSSLKLCLVAEGAADFYPRLAPTSEWDTAAAHAVVAAAGGKVVDTKFMPLRYNAKEDILNPFFYVIGDPDFPWEEILEDVHAPE